MCREEQGTLSHEELHQQGVPHEHSHGHVHSHQHTRAGSTAWPGPSATWSG